MLHICGSIQRYQKMSPSARRGTLGTILFNKHAQIIVQSCAKNAPSWSLLQTFAGTRNKHCSWGDSIASTETLRLLQGDPHRDTLQTWALHQKQGRLEHHERSAGRWAWQHQRRNKETVSGQVLLPLGQRDRPQAVQTWRADSLMLEVHPLYFIGSCGYREKKKAVIARKDFVPRQWSCRLEFLWGNPVGWPAECFRKPWGANP